jgi:hypothetical protein
LVVALLGSASACTRHLEPTPELRLSPGEPLPLRAAVVVSPELREREDVIGKFAMLGIANTWAMSTGAGLAPAVEQMARATFRDVEVVEEAARGFDVVLTPTVEKLRHVEEREGFWFVFRLHARATNRSGQVVLERSYEELEEGSAAGVWGGAFAAAAVITNPIERAMARVLKRLGEDLRGVLDGQAVLAAPEVPQPVLVPARAPRAAPVQQAPDKAGGCNPACGPAFLCHKGVCVSLCNPPCAAGEVCTSKATCVLSPPPAVKPVPPPEPVRPPPPDRTPLKVTPAPGDEPVKPAPEPEPVKPAPEPEPVKPAPVEEPEPPPIPFADQPVSGFSAHLSVTDALLFGLAPVAELSVPERFSVFAQVRVMNSGLMSAMNEPPLPHPPVPVTPEAISYGLGFGVGANHYFGGLRGLRGPYLGLGAEVLYQQFSLAYNGAWKEGVLTHTSVVPNAVGGWRWRAGRFLLGIGARAGVGFRLASTYTNPSGQTVNWGYSEAVFFDYGLALEVGFYVD